MSREDGLRKRSYDMGVWIGWIVHVHFVCLVVAPRDRLYDLIDI